MWRLRETIRMYLFWGGVIAAVLTVWATHQQFSTVSVNGSHASYKSCNLKMHGGQWRLCIAIWAIYFSLRFTMHIWFWRQLYFRVSAASEHAWTTNGKNSSFGSVSATVLKVYARQLFFLYDRWCSHVLEDLLWCY